MDRVLRALNLPARSWSLHIGAGELEEMNTYKELKIKPVWVEARPQAVIDAKCTWPFQTVIQACVSDESGKIVKFCEGRDGSKSGLQVDESKVTLRGYRHMKTVTIDNLLSANRLAENRFALLVISTEGTELQIIRTVPEKMWESLKAVIICFHDDIQRKHVEEVLSCLFEDTFVYENWVIGCEKGKRPQI
jgi:FkbM family methyltransferase